MFLIWFLITYDARFKGPSSAVKLRLDRKLAAVELVGKHTTGRGAVVYNDYDSSMHGGGGGSSDAAAAAAKGTERMVGEERESSSRSGGVGGGDGGGDGKNGGEGDKADVLLPTPATDAGGNAAATEVAAAAPSTLNAIHASSPQATRASSRLHPTRTTLPKVESDPFTTPIKAPRRSSVPMLVTGDTPYGTPFETPAHQITPSSAAPPKMRGSEASDVASAPLLASVAAADLGSPPRAFARRLAPVVGMRENPFCTKRSRLKFSKATVLHAITSLSRRRKPQIFKIGLV